jgi:hypothetical protein
MSGEAGLEGLCGELSAHDEPALKEGATPRYPGVAPRC